MGKMIDTMDEMMTVREKVLAAQATERDVQKDIDALTARVAEESAALAKRLAEAQVAVRRTFKQYLELANQVPQLLATDIHGIGGKLIKKPEPEQVAESASVGEPSDKKFVEIELLTEVDVGLDVLVQQSSGDVVDMQEATSAAE